MKEINTELVIVGAGPGGLMAARTAAKNGLGVHLVEKQYEIGYPIRTSGGSYPSDMKELGIPERYYNKIRRFIFATKNRAVDFSYKQFGFCVIDTRSAWQYLAMDAAKHGCELSVGTDVRYPILENGYVKGVQARKANEDIKFKSKVVIDASGSSAVVARNIGAFPKDAKTILSAGIEYEAYVENLEKDTAILIVGEKTAPAGYAWVFPISDDRARIGIGLTGLKGATEYPYKLLDNLITKRPSCMESLGKITPIEMHAGTIPTEPLPHFYIDNGIMIIGDAAFQATQIVGEGIRIAMKSGNLAANVAERAIKNNDTSKKAFREYEKYANKIAKNNKIGTMVQKRIAAHSDKDWDETADTTLKSLAKMPMEDTITLLKTDFTKRKILGILARNPSLLKDIGFREIKRML